MIKSKFVFGENLCEDMVREEKSERRFSLLLIILLFWVYLQVIAVLEPLPVQYVSIALQLKNVSGVIAVVVGTALYFDRLKLNRYAILPLIYCGFAFFSLSLSSFRNSNVSLDSLYIVLMYFIWSWMMFVLGPVVFDSHENIKTFLKWAVLGTGLIFLLGLFWSLSVGIPITQVFGGSRGGAERYSYGFRHVGYIGSILTSVVVGTMFLDTFSTNKRTHAKWLILFIVSLIVMVLTDSRSYMVFVAVVWFVHLALNPRYSKLVLYIGGFGLIALFFWVDRKFLLSENPMQQINYYSSGRIVIWQAAIQNTMESITTVLLGSGNISGWTTVFQTISGDTIIKPFQRFAVDNIYVEIFSLYGLVGLVLFLWAMFRIIKIGIVQLRNNEQNGLYKSRLSIAIGVMVAMLISSITSSNMPSMGNLLNIILLFVSVAVIINSTSETLLHRS